MSTIPTYDATSIKILTPLEAEESFSWLKIEHLAQKYLRDKAWIAAGLEACRRCGVGQEYFIKYYLDKDKSVEFIPEVEMVYREMKKEVA